MFKNEKNLRHHFKTHHEQGQPRKQTNTQRTKAKKNEGGGGDKAKTGGGEAGSEESGEVKKEKKEPPKYQCHMCDIPVMFALTALRRHLARKHSTNFKCTKEGCDKTFAKQYQVRTDIFDNLVLCSSPLNLGINDLFGNTEIEH